MVNTVRTRPNHYELLGLKPTAGRDEIDDAFAQAMRRPHVITEVAEIGIAFDTLRSASKRRAYDEALGLRREPEPVPPAMSFRISARLAAIASPEPLARSSPRPSPPAASPALQPPSRQEPPKRPGVLFRPLADPPAEFAPRRPIGPILTLHANEPEASWKYPALAFGAVLLGVVLVGAWAGAHVQDPAGSDAQASASSVRHHAKAAVPPEVVPDSQPAAQSPAPTEALRTRPAPSLRRARVQANRLAEVDETLASQPQEQAAGDQATPEASASAPASTEAPTEPLAGAARLPLPGAVVARTIDRIGYSCGSVASSTSAGAPGVYKVTCTSGQSYQAKPVHGRYRFRHW